MKKLFALIAVFGMLFMGASIFAQDETTEAPAADDTTRLLKRLQLHRPSLLLLRHRLKKEVEFQFCTPLLKPNLLKVVPVLWALYF